MNQPSVRTFGVVVALFLLPLAGGSSTAHAASSSPNALRKEAMKLFEKGRSSNDNRREYYKLAEDKVKEAVAILEKRSRRSRADEELLVELQSLLYWIRKMTPLDLGREAPRPAPRTEKKPPTPNEPAARPPAVPSRPRPKPPASPPSRSFRGLPARLEPIATTIRARYELAYTSHDEVEKMRYEFYLRDFRQAYMLRKHPKRSIEGAALVFEAIDKYDLNLVGAMVTVVRMQACLELDRLYRTKPSKEMKSGVLRHLKSAYWNLAICQYDFEPAVQYFNLISRKGVKHPDVKLGLALAKLAQSYVISQARVKPTALAKIGREEIKTWFGSYGQKLWCDAYKKYNWSKDRMKEVGEDSRRLFKEYAAEVPRGYIYEAFSESFWLWYYKDTAGFNAKSQEAFSRIDPAECTDAENTMLRVIVTRWMRKNGHVNSGKVKWE